MSNLQKNLLKSKLPPSIPRPAKNHPGRQKDYSPAIWSDYFHDFVDVSVDNNSFRVYRTKPSEVEDSPLLVLLHGGGFSALSWSVFSTEITSIINCQCLAIDFRGHGDTKTDDDYDLSAATMAMDVASVIHKLYDDKQPIRNVLIMGHSMGGAVAIHIADMKLLPSLVGIIVIDVVEGTAMESLQSMQSFLRSRPNHFKSIKTAIEWCVRSGQIRNIDSAKVSMPGQIVNTENGKLAAMELPLSEPADPTSSMDPNAIPEDFQVPSTPMTLTDTKKYTWRIDLSRTEKFWKGWFEGLSEKFLQTPIPKLLILAGIDNLDKTLQIGQMQGRFQLQVLARTGHAVHEDQPHHVAETLGTYLVRNRFATPRNDFNRVMPEC